ncbi:hypothetical protein Tco_0949985 [Tanacetum coccineum]
MLYSSFRELILLLCCLLRWMPLTSLSALFIPDFRRRIFRTRFLMLCRCSLHGNAAKFEVSKDTDLEDPSGKSLEFLGSMNEIYMPHGNLVERIGNFSLCGMDLPHMEKSIVVDNVTNRSKDSSSVPVLENLWIEDKMRQFGLSDFTFLPIGICDKRRPQANLGDHMPSRVYETKGRMEATRGH